MSKLDDLCHQRGAHDFVAKAESVNVNYNWMIYTCSDCGKRTQRPENCQAMIFSRSPMAKEEKERVKKLARGLSGTEENQIFTLPCEEAQLVAKYLNKVLGIK